MHFREPSSREQLICAWLRSEWGAPPPRSADRRVVDEPNFDNQAENATRLELLYRDREVILGHVPVGGDYLWVDIEATDLASLYILPCLEWYLDTGGSFRVIDTVANLSRGRRFRWGSHVQQIDHLTAIDALASKLKGYDAVATDEILILIAADKAGPYTIIDGTHRTAALYRNHLAEPNLPWRGLLAVDPAMAACQWHIESAQSQANIRACREQTLLGALR